MRRFGLIGRPLGHSNSARYFTAKFEREHIDAEYRLYELPEIDALETLLPNDIEGFNVTIPYKKEVMAYLDDISDEARAIGAVNCVKCHSGRRAGFNTDVEGIRRSLDRLLGDDTSVRALLLGTGGAAQAVEYVLMERNIEFAIVSRDPLRGNMTYAGITPDTLSEYRLIINATPVGMFPHVGEAPELPYDALTPGHYMFDTIYNPPCTLFLELGAKAGASTLNGETMFVSQAEASWRIWNG